MGACGSQIQKEKPYPSPKLIEDKTTVSNIEEIQEEQHEEAKKINTEDEGKNANKSAVRSTSLATSNSPQQITKHIQPDDDNKPSLNNKSKSNTGDIDDGNDTMNTTQQITKQIIDDQKEQTTVDQTAKKSVIVNISITNKNKLSHLIAGFIYNITDNINSERRNIPSNILNLCIAFYCMDGIDSNSNIISDFDEKDDIYKDSNNDIFNDNDNGPTSWGNSLSLIFSDQQIVLKTIESNKEDDAALLLKNALERRRQENSNLSKFWKCGNCEFLNHPTLAICMACNLPQTDIIYYLLCCDMKNELKSCPNCNAYIIPKDYIDHLTDCQQSLHLHVNNKNVAQSWYVKLTICEKNAITHVQSLAMTKSLCVDQEEKIMNIMSSIDSKYGNKETLDELHKFMEWKVPIIIHVHCADTIPLLLKDTHYRNLFEIHAGSGCTNQKTRKLFEQKMFDDVYDRALPFERPKYGCLNVGLQPYGVTRAKQYGDGYFLMNDTTVRWRTTMTIKDSFEVDGNCGTLKHCNHLLSELNKKELKELIEAALYGKKSGQQQLAYREIQIHGPVQLNRDIKSLHVPKTEKNIMKIDLFETFAQKNNCQLVWF